MADIATDQSPTYDQAEQADWHAPGARITPGQRVSMLRAAPALGLAEYTDHGTVTRASGLDVTVAWDRTGAVTTARARDLIRA